MNTFDIILQQVGLFVIYILAGLLLVKTKVLNRETLEPISKFVIKMALPLMVFINITDGTDKKNLYESWPILVIAVGFYICIYAAGAMAVKFFKLQESRVGIYRAMLLLYASVFMLIDQFMLWTLGVKLTSPTGEGGFKLKKMINPATVAIVLAIVLKFTGIRIPVLLDTAFSKTGSTASPLAMIYVGGIFAGISLKKYLREISLYGIVLLKMILAPVFLFLILGLFPVSGELRLATSLIVGMPTMTAVVMMANASGLDGDYALGGVFITTISGIITLPAVCWLLQYVL